MRTGRARPQRVVRDSFIGQHFRSAWAILQAVSEVRATLVTLGVIAAGWLSFELIPNTLDNYLHTFNTWSVFFFFTAAALFMNIHHYFIDNVIWRFKDPVVRKYLLA